MTNPILLKKSSVAAKAPLATDIDFGELALNYTDGRLYYKTSMLEVKYFIDSDAVLSKFGASSIYGVSDWNDVTNIVPGTGPSMLLGNATNGPGTGSVYYHPFNIVYGQKDGTGQITQMAIRFADGGNDLQMRGRHLGSWSSWVQFLNSGNYNSYAPGLDGTGATGNWPINVTGSAATLTTPRTINGVSFNGSGNITLPGYDSTFRRIINPGGASYEGSGSITGAIAITLPVGWVGSMFRATATIYNYSTGTSFRLEFGGYLYSAGSWVNTFAYITGMPEYDLRHAVRFGYTASGKGVIYIGELASVWSYPKIAVTDVYVGHNGNSVVWESGWSVGTVTAFESAWVTWSGISVCSTYAVATNTPSSLVKRDASGNFSAGTVTAALTGNASTATTLQTTRTLWGQSFNGSGNVTGTIDVFGIARLGLQASGINGTVLLEDRYSGTEGLVSLSTIRGTGGTMLGNGVMQAENAAGYLSSVGIAFARSAIALESGNIKFQNAASSTVARGSAVTLNTQATIDTLGNFGLGVVPSAWASTYKASEVRTGAVYDTAVGTGTGLAFNTYYNGTNWIYKGTGGNATAMRYEQTGGQHLWFSAASGAGGTTASFSSVMSLDSSGNLGIGTTTIGGNTTNRVVRAEGIDSANFSVTKTSAESGSITASAGAIRVGSDTVHPTIIKSSGYDVIKITPNGKVGIGTGTGDIDTTLHIGGAFSSNPQIKLQSGMGFGLGTSITGYRDNIQSYYIGDISFRANTLASGLALVAINNEPVSIYTANTERLTIDSAGNINVIGTGKKFTADFSNATVSDRLLFQSNVLHGDTNIDVIPNAASVTTSIGLWGSSTQTDTSIFRLSNTGTEARINSGRNGTGTYNPMTFYAGGSEKLRLSSTGPYIQADFSTSTFTSHAAFQTSVVNGNTEVWVIPNGTGTGGGVAVLNNSTPTNSPFINTSITSVDTRISSGALGTGTLLPLIFNAGGADRMKLATDGTFTSISGAIGYSVGAGGTVTQVTSKTTAVTLNKPNGQITMHNAALAAGAVVTFVVNNSLLTNTDKVIVGGDYVTVDPQNYRVELAYSGTGSFMVRVTNISGGSLSQALVVGFAIIKGSTT